VRGGAVAGKEARRVAADLRVVKARVERLLPGGVRGGVLRRLPGPETAVFGM
jgi:hypothetical protein